MQSSKSDKSVSSKRCCNRSTCPFYMCTNEHNGTAYQSAEESTSTKFLYIGQNFQHQQSGELQEFKDCGSETEIVHCPARQKRNKMPSCSKNMNMDPNDYCNALKQIIAMSQKLLERIERTEQGTITSSGRTGPDSSMRQPSAKCGQSNMTSPTTFGNSGPNSQNIRIFQMEPVQINVPFVVRFDNKGMATICPSGTSGMSGQMPTMSYRPEIPQVSSKSAIEQFPYTSTTRDDICVSEGKFPSANVDIMGEEANKFKPCFGSALETCDPSCRDPCAAEMKTSRGQKVDKEIQTERKSKKVKPNPNNAQCQTGDEHSKFYTPVSSYYTYPELRTLGPKEPSKARSCICNDCTCSPPVKRKLKVCVCEDKETETEMNLKCICDVCLSQTRVDKEAGPILPEEITYSDCDEHVCGELIEEIELPPPLKMAKNLEPEPVTEPKPAVEPEPKPEAESQPITQLITEPILEPIAEHLPEPKSELLVEEHKFEPEPKPNEPELELKPEALKSSSVIKQEPQPDPEKLKKIQSIISELIPPKPPRKVYRQALPQHKDLEICNKCRFHPSPLFDENGRVFCPGNCGCCLCPWKMPRKTDFLKTTELKICKCRDRITMFTESDGRPGSICSSASFDVCPCREKAAEKFAELFGSDMYGPDDSLAENCFGHEVLLSDVIEIGKPVAP